MTDEPRAPRYWEADDADEPPPPRGPAPDADPSDATGEQYTTALYRPSDPPPGHPRGPATPPGPIDHQETTVLRRPGGIPAAPNLPGARRRPDLPDYTPPALDQHHDDPDSHPGHGAGAAYPATAAYPGGYPAPPEQTARPEPLPRDPRRGRTSRSAAAHPDVPVSEGPEEHRRGLPHAPRKLTVTRVAAMRSRQLTHRGLEKFHGAVVKDGADRSGLGHLTYAVMGNYAVDAALAVALANTLFFAAAKAESAANVLLYLLLTVAPFAVIAPLIGPLLDRMQRGRRLALAASSFGRAALAVVMALNFDSWIIYPCALGMLVLSKSFGVLKAALTPRVLPETITLVKTNSRMSVFGLIAGGVAGAIAAGISGLTNSAGALWFTAACGLVGAWLCLRIPAWVESTAGEVPVAHSVALPRPDPQAAPRGGTSQPPRRGMPRIAAAALWTNATIRIETGFLALFIAFVIKSRFQSASLVDDGSPAPVPIGDDEGWMQLLLLAAVGAAAGAGGFLGNALGARLTLRSPEAVALVCLGTVIAAVITAFLIPGLMAATVVALVGSTCSSLAKVCLDSSIQHNLPEASRASAFGRSEAVLQLGWVFGGVTGLLIGGVWTIDADSVYQVGFGVVAVLLALSSVQAVALFYGRSIFPDEGIIGAIRSRRATKRAATAPAASPGASPTAWPAPPTSPPATEWGGRGSGRRGSGGAGAGRRTRKAGGR